MRRLLGIASVALFLVGAGSLALTLYLWFGDWPTRMRDVVEHHRSAAENAGRPPEPLIANVSARERRSLNGRWQAVIDPYERGDLLGIAPLAIEPRSPSDLSEFSFEDGLELDVPGDWNTQDPRLVFYQGVVWYKRTFEHERDPAPARHFLHFGAVNYRAAVYLNGRLLGEHQGGFTPFNFEVTGRLREGGNLLVVRVDSRLGDEDVPTATTDWLNHGGITRDVSLVRVPPLFVRDYHVGLAETGGVRGWVQLEGGAAGAAAGAAVVLRIPALDVDEALESDAEGRAAFELEVRPQRWSPESPWLYEVEIRAGEDAVRDRIGFRRVETVGGEILLNGAPVFLRGISIHEEAPFGGGRVHRREDAATLLDWAEELGCNFVRLAHYPHNEHMARLADERGLLVWAEIPVYWNVAFESPAALERARRQLSELIDRDRNRASVIFWSIGNETPVNEARQRFMGALVDHVRERDASRLVTAALLPEPSMLARFFGLHYAPAVLGLVRDEWRYEVRDPLGALTDVPALNEYFGWYYTGAIGLLTPLSSAHARRVMLDNLDRVRIETGLAPPLVISEFGAGALAGLRAPEDELAVYSEEYQALVYRRQLAMLRRQPDLRGMSPWILKDFRSPLRLYQGVQDHWNRKGLVADDGRHKLAFRVLRDFYRELAASGGAAGS